MLVLAAPASDDPRDGGFNHAIPGELLYRPFVCDSGMDDTCGCERSWAGLGSSKATTIAEVLDKPDLSKADYLRTIGRFLAETWGWDVKNAVDEAEHLAELAEHFGAGAYVTITRDGDGHIFDVLDADHV